MALLLCVPLVLDNPSGFLGYQSVFLAITPLVLLAVIVIAASNDLIVAIPQHVILSTSAFITATIVSALVSRAPLASVFGAAGRASGLASLVLLVGIGWAGVIIGRHHVGVAIARRALLIVGVIIAIGSLLQRAHILLPGYSALGPSGRILGPMGSAAQLGAVMLLFLACGISLVVDDTETTAWRKAGAVGSIPFLAVLVLSGARAAWIGAVVGCVFAIAHPQVRTFVSRQRRAFIGVVTALILLLVLAVPIMRDRLFSLFDLSGGTVGGRVDIWRAAIPGWWERPLQGFGLDQARAPIMRHLATSFETTYGTGETVDRAHSVILDQLLWGGVLGLGALLAMVVAWWRCLRVRTMTAQSLVLVAGLVAFATHLVFNFPVPEIDRLAWLIAGLLLGSATAATATTTTRSRIVVTALLGGAMVPLAITGLLNIVADQRLHDAITSERKQDLAVSVVKYKQARSAAAFMPLYRESYARILARTSGGVDITDAARYARQSNPGDPILVELELRARTQVAFAARDTAAGEELVSLYESLCSQYPSRVPFQVGLALAQLTSGDVEAARVTATSASTRAPKDPSPEYVLALIENTLGNTAQAEIHSKEAARREAK